MHVRLLGGEHVAHEDLLDILRLEAGALNSGWQIVNYGHSNIELIIPYP